MAESEERYGMSKLEGASHFRTWRIQIKALLMERRLWAYVEESVELNNYPTDKEVEAHEHKLQSAYTKIIMSMSTPMVALCQADTTAKQVWKTLHEQFDKSTNLAKLRMKCKHMTTKLREGESVEQHVRVMKELTDRLAVMGSPVSEEDQAMVLLLSLPPSFRSLVSALAAPAKIDLAIITNGILEHELRTSGDQEEDHALFGSANTNRRYPKNANGNPSHNTGMKKEFPCHGCGRIGHLSVTAQTLMVIVIIINRVHHKVLQRTGDLSFVIPNTKRSLYRRVMNMILLCSVCTRICMIRSEVIGSLIVVLQVICHGKEKYLLRIKN